MTRKIFTIAMLVVVSGSALLATGCATGSGNSGAPYSLTGSQTPAMTDTERNKAAARGDYSWKYRAPAVEGTNSR